MSSNIGFVSTWLLCIGFMVIMFSSFRRSRRKYRLQRMDGAASNGAIAILDERYADGEIGRDEYARMKSRIFWTQR